MKTADIGIGLPQYGKNASKEAIVRVAQEAEHLGYGSAWVMERLLRSIAPVLSPQGTVSLMPEYYSNVFDPIETLTYVAAKTERIKLGTGIIDALFHVPVVLARRLATLDQYSDGRVIAGMGQGFYSDEFATANVPMKRRGGGMEEYVSALRAIWGPDPVRFSGRFYQIPEAQIGPKPRQSAGPPIILGGFAPAARERAARIADGIMPIAFSLEMLEQSLNQFRDFAKAAGRDPSKLLVMLIGRHRLSETPMAAPRPLLSGSVEQIREDLQSVEGFGVNHVILDLNEHATPADQQVRFLEQLQS